MTKWIRSGLVWGGILYIITMLLFPLFDRENYDTVKLLLGIPLWIITGLTMAWLLEKRKRKTSRK